MCASLQKAVRTEARDGREAESGVLHVADLKFWDLERVYVWAECVDRS